MSLKVSVSTENDITIIFLKGKLSYENQVEFSESITNLLKKNHEVILDMGGLNFVGSSGITDFVRTLKNARQARFCNVSIEFQKIMGAHDIQQEQIYSSRSDAVQSFFRKGTLENN